MFITVGFMSGPTEDDFGASEKQNGVPAARFATLLRALRIKAGLTQQELADRAGIGVRTVRELERARVARPQRGTVGLLADAFGLTGVTRHGFVAAGRSVRVVRSPAGSAESSVRPGARPAGQLTGQVERLAGQVERITGRGDDLAELAGLLGAGQSVALVGLGGVGKTCLARAVATSSAERFPGGVALLAPDPVGGRSVIRAVDSLEVLVGSMASAFGVDGLADLARRCADAPALLVVDGAEGAGAAGPAVAALHARVPSLRFLITSRRPLDLPGVLDWQVDPLEVPPAGAPAEISALRKYSAVELFEARLAQVRVRPLADREGPTLVELVRRLSGLPLAIELAAACGGVAELADLSNRYRDRELELAPTSSGRLTLRAAIAGSCELLDPATWRALRRLSVLRGAWSLDLAGELLDDLPNVDPERVLDRLVWHGMVRLTGVGRSSGLRAGSGPFRSPRAFGLAEDRSGDSGGDSGQRAAGRPEPDPFRYRLVELVARHALGQCARSGELRTAGWRHARVFARLVLGRGAVQGHSSDRGGVSADAIIDDVRAAAGCVDADPADHAVLNQWLQHRPA